MKNISFTHRVLGLLLVFSFIFSPLLVTAQARNELPGTGLPAPVSNTPPAETNQKPPSPDQRLEQERREDQRKCEDKASLIGDQSAKPGTLSNILSDVFREQLAKHVESFFSNQLPHLLEGTVNTRLPGLIQSNLRRDLNYRTKTAAYERYGTTRVSPEQLAPIIREVTDALTAETTADAMPELTRLTIRENLPLYVKDQFILDANGAINNGAYAQRVREAVDEMARVAQEAQTKALADIAMQVVSMASGGGFGIQQLLGIGMAVLPSVSQLISQSQSQMGMTFTEEGKQELVNIIMQQTASSTIEGIAESTEIEDFADILGDNYASGITPDLLSQFSSSFGDLSSNSGFSSAVDTTLGGFTGQDFDLTGGLSGDFLNPMVTAMLPSIGEWSYGFTSHLMDGGSFMGALDWQGFSESDLVGGGLAGATDGPPVFSGGEVNPAGAIKSSQSYGNAATGPANAAQTNLTTTGADKAGLAAGASKSFAKMGEAMKGALPGMVGGMVGDLAGNIPVVGGLVAPMATVATTAAVRAIMGLPITMQSLGLLTSDIGLGIGVGQGFSNVGKAIGEVIKTTSKSNQNEEHLNKTQDEAKAQLVQMCMYERAMKRMADRQAEKELINDRDSYKAGLMAQRQLNNGLKDYFARSYEVSPGLRGTTGTAAGDKAAENVVADRRQDVADAGAEARIAAREDIRRSDAPHAQDAAATLQRAENYDPLASTMTQEEIDSLNNPENLDADTLRARRLEYLNPFGNNNRDSAFLTYQQYQQQAEAEAEAVARDEYQAGQGYRPGRECAVWTTENGKEVCRAWRVITPGSTNKAISDASYTAIFDRLSNMDEEGEDSVIELLTNLFWSFKNPGASSQEAGTNKAVGPDKCPGPEPCSNAGWQPQQLSSRTLNNLSSNDLAKLFDLFIGFLDGFNPDSNDFQLPNVDDSSTITFEIDSFGYSPETSMISWEAWSAYNCTAANDWLGTEIETGEDLLFWGGAVGQATTTLPSIHEDLNYELTCSGGYPISTKSTSFTIPGTNTNP